MAIPLNKIFFKKHNKVKLTVFLKEKYFDEVEAQTWNHQTFFCIVYLTKIQKRNFFLVFLRQPVNVVLNR
jgi:hypothetical protein